MTIICAALLGAAAATAAAAPPAPDAPAPLTPEPVEIAAPGLKLKAFLYRPQGDGPFPAVVALHTCDGLAGRRSGIARRYRDWGERFAAAGYVALFPDSFGSRGLKSQCIPGQRTLRSGRDRVVDADAARHWLQQRNVLVNGAPAHVHVGTDQAARQDAMKRVAEWLAR